MSDARIYYLSAPTRRLLGRGTAYRVIGRRDVRAIRIAYRERRTRRVHPDEVRIGMAPLLRQRAHATVLPSGERIDHLDRTAS